MLTPLLDLLVLFVLTVPLVGFIGRKVENEKRVVCIYIIFALSLLFSLTIYFYNEILWSNVSLIYDIDYFSDIGYFEIDALGVFISLIFLGIGVIISIFSMDEIESNRITGYFTVLLAMILGMIGILFATDFFTLFIFWEIMRWTLINYVLH